VDNAQGDYLLLFHDDDVIDSDLVSVCMRAAEGRSDYGLIRTGTRLIDGGGKLIRDIPNRAAGLDYNDFFRGWMQDRYTSYVCSTLFNTKLLKEIGGFQSEHGLYQDLIAVAKLIARAGHCDVEDVKASFRRHDENYGNAAELKAWCEDGRQLAETIAVEAPFDNDRMYNESMRYLCTRVYGYAHRFLPHRMDRIRAYRMIDAEFGNCYPAKKYLFDRIVVRRYRDVRRSARRAAKQLIGRQSTVST